VPLVQVRHSRSEDWCYIVILPPALRSEHVIHIDKGEFLPVPAAQKIVHAIRRNEVCGEADGFAWRYRISPAREPRRGTGGGCNERGHLRGISYAETKPTTPSQLH
jgi:hypothetical protein